MLQLEAYQKRQAQALLEEEEEEITSFQPHQAD